MDVVDNVVVVDDVAHSVVVAVFFLATAPANVVACHIIVVVIVDVYLNELWLLLMLL